MGITKKDLELIIILKTEFNIDFTSIVTIGRQKIGFSYKEVEKIFSKYNLTTDNNELKKELENNNFFCEPIFKKLGALHIHSIDIDNYESTTFRHDLNKPITKKLEENYSLVMDFGSSEHIFDVKSCQKNILSLVKKGGHLIQILPTNNESGHGFYQFSASFFTEILSSDNGYELLRLFSYRTNSKKIYEVLLDRLKNKRVRLVNNHPTYLFALSKRNEVKEIFKSTPQQSDYQSLRWKEKTHKTYIDILYEKFPFPQLAKYINNPFKSFFFGHLNKENYKRYKI